MVTFVFANVVHAQGVKQPSAAAKDTARTLLVDCREKFGKKDHAGALKSCRGAHSIMGVPTTGLDLAKVQQAMGLLVEARETALEAARFDNSTNNAAFAQAQAEANKIAQDLDKRIPSLVITVSGLPSQMTPRVVVDSDEVPAAAMSLPFRVNPGERTIVASAKGFADAKRTTTVSEGQTVSIDLLMRPPVVEKPGAGRNIPVWTWVAGGVGVIGAAGAVFFGLEFANTQDRVTRDCPDNQCSSNYTTQEALDLEADWNRALALTIVSGTVGAACLGAAVFGIATAPKKAETTARILPWIGRDVGGAIVQGSF